MNVASSRSTASRISERLRTELASRKYGVGDRLPTVRDLAQRFKCSIATIQEALAPLYEEGAIESRGRHGLFVRALPAAGKHHGRILCLFPKWDWVKDKPFAAQYLLGVTLAASEHGYSVESFPYLMHEELDALGPRLHPGHYAGLVWANPTASTRILGLLSRLEAAGIRTVTSIRHFGAIALPRTSDDYAQGYAQVVEHIRRRGVRRMGVLAGSADDETHGPALAKLVDMLRSASVEVPEDLVLHVRATGIEATERAILCTRFLSERERWDGCWAFAPDALDALRGVAAENRIDLADRFLGVQTVRAMPAHGANLILESDPQSHGREAFLLLHQWLETGRRPTETLIPMVCRKDRPSPETAE